MQRYEKECLSEQKAMDFFLFKLFFVLLRTKNKLRNKRQWIITHRQEKE